MTDHSASRITLATLEKVIARLKLTEFFSFGQGELNQSHGHWDVFPDVESLDDFDPTDEGDANEFLMWARAAGDAAFDDDGVLRHPLPIVWGGSFADLQTAFAEAGLAVRIELDEEPREPYGQSGRLVLSPRSASADCDLLVMLRAFAELEQAGIVALANAGYTQSDGWTDVAERAGGAETTAVFWHAQKHDAFDGLGNLASPLLLHWRGDANAIIAGLRRAGFAVAAAPPEHTCIEVTSGPTTAAQLESFEDASARWRGAAPPAAPSRAAVWHGGPLELVHTFRGRDRQPVVRFAFDPRVPARLAFAQAMDARGFPTSPAYVVDLARQAVERALLPDQRAMGVGGMRFLRDGRLVFCTTQLRSAGADVHQGSCLVLHAWASELPSEEEILVQAFSHIDNTALLSFDDAERWAAVGQPRGCRRVRDPCTWRAVASADPPARPGRARPRVHANGRISRRCLRGLVRRLVRAARLPSSVRAARCAGVILLTTSPDRSCAARPTRRSWRCRSGAATRTAAGSSCSVSIPESRPTARSPRPPAARAALRFILPVAVSRSVAMTAVRASTRSPTER